MDMKFGLSRDANGKGWLVRGIQPIFELAEENLILVPFITLAHLNPHSPKYTPKEREDIICAAAKLRRDLYAAKLAGTEKFLAVCLKARQLNQAKFENGQWCKKYHQWRGQ